MDSVPREGRGGREGVEFVPSCDASKGLLMPHLHDLAEAIGFGGPLSWCASPARVRWGPVKALSGSRLQLVRGIHKHSFLGV